MPSQIKGTAIQIYLEWLRAKVPAAQVESILERLPEAGRAEVLLRLLPSEQYPYARYAELLEATRAVLGEAYEHLAFDHGRYAAEALIGAVYKQTVKAGDIERTLESLARGWRLYFDTGQILIIEHAPGRYVFAIIDARYHPLHPPISAGYVQRACEKAGAAAVKVERHGSPPRVELVITWS
jgi:uncharacterized protein DUF2378